MSSSVTTILQGAPAVTCVPKGKVERGIGYLKRSFLEGRQFTDLGDLNAQLDGWIASVANVREHGTLRCKPIDRYEHERQMLHARAAVAPYDTRQHEFRTVSTDSHISYNGLWYSVWPDPRLKMVTVRAEGEQIGAPFTVYGGGRVVAEHRIAPRGQVRVTLPEHEREIRRLSRATHMRRRARSAPKFHQLTQSEVDLTMTALPVVSVQGVSLQPYERLLMEANR